MTSHATQELNQINVLLFWSFDAFVGGSMTDSTVWNAMTTSMQLAQECLKEDPSTGEEEAEASPPFEGLESFAQTIESGS